MKKLGWFYKPTSIIGWLITIAAIILCVHDFIAVDRNSHSATDTIYNFMPYGFIYIATWLWVSSKMNKQLKNNFNHIDA